MVQMLIDVIGAVNLAASRHSDSLAAIRGAFVASRGKGIWKLEIGMNGKGQGWMGAGNFVKNLRYFILRLTFSRKRLAAGLRPDPLGRT